MPYINLAEQADAQRQVQALQEQLQQEMVTATGMGEDFDMELAGQMPSPPAQDLSQLQGSPDQ